MLNKKDKFLAAAQKLLEKGSLDKALAEFLKAAGEDPKDTRTWLKVAEVHVRRGAKQEAVDVYLRTADLYTEQGFFQRAVAVYKNILKISPGYVPAHFKLAGLFKQLGLLSDAMNQYELVAQVYQRSGKAHDALDAMRKLVELNPDHAPGHIKLAEAAAKAGLADEAASEFGRATELLRAAGKMEEFLRVGERLLTVAPNEFAFAKELAALYLDRNNARFALAKLQPCFNADPKDAETLGLLVRCFEQLGQTAKALSALRELAKVHADAGRTGEQREALKKILAMDPRDAQARDAIARIESNRPSSSVTIPAVRPIGPGYSAPPPSSAAITFSEMAIPEFLLPKEPTGSFPAPSLGGPDASTTQERVAVAAALFQRGQRTNEEQQAEIARILSEVDVFVKFGLLERAADHVRKVLELAPDHVPAREQRARILAELGRNAEAARELQRLADQHQATNPAAAADYRRRALEADPAPVPDSGAIVGAASRPSAAMPAGDSGELLDVEELLDSDLLEEEDEAASPATLETPAVGAGALLPDLDSLAPEPLTFDAGGSSGPGAVPQAREPDERSESIELDLDPGGAADATGPIPLELPNGEITPSLELAPISGAPAASAALESLAADFGRPPSSGSFDRVPRTIMDDRSDERAGARESFDDAAPTQTSTPAVPLPDPMPLSETTGTIAVAADLEQVDFFLSQGLVDDAASMLDDLAARYPLRPGIAERRARIAAMRSGGSVAGAVPQAQPGPSGSRGADAGEKRSDVAPRAIVAGGDPADASTHGDLGIAYKEMGLFDAAIKEFRQLAADPGREVFALTMMGECYEATGALADAVIQYKKALNRPHITDAEATQLYFQLGHVFEALGDRKEALYFFEKVAKRDPKFRDVTRRVAALKGGGSSARPAGEPTSQGDEFDAAFDALLGSDKRG